MALLYANENFPLPVVEQLRQLGHDVLTMHEAGKAQQALDDASVLESAKQDNRAVLTLNRRHFIRLHDQRPDHMGILVCTFDVDFAGQAARINAAIEAEQPLSGKLIRVNRPG